MRELGATSTGLSHWKWRKDRRPLDLAGTPLGIGLARPRVRLRKSRSSARRSMPIFRMGETWGLSNRAADHVD
eukprot:971641-Pyramimonas_sp.AAC.1